MSKYINADKLKAEIKRRIELISHGDAHPEVMKRVEGVLKGYNSILSFIDSLQQEQPGVDLEKEYTEFVVADPVYSKLVNGIVGKAIARHFYELGQKEMRERIANPQYNQKVIAKMKYEIPTEKLSAEKEE